MSIKIKNYNFSKISNDFKIGLKDYKELYVNGKPLKDLLETKNYTLDIQSGRTPSKFNENYWNGEYDFITMADVNTLTYTINNDVKEKITEEAIENEKNLVRVPKGSFIVSNAMTIGLAFISNKDVFINQNVFWLKLDRSAVNTKFLLWYFNIYIRRIFQEVYSAKYLSKQELSRINVPNVSLEKQNEFEEKVKPYETEITILQNSIIDNEHIINDIFSKYFRYDKKIIYKVHKGMTYGTQKNGNTNFCITNSRFSNITDSKYRVSTRANNSIIKEIYKILKEFGTIKTKDIVIEPIHRGKSPNYDKNGKIPVVKTAHITNNGINTVFDEFVNDEFYKKKVDAQLKKGDILLTSTGKPSIGKIDIYESEDNAIADGHLSIIRINKRKYNPRFFVYFIRSVLGYVQLEKEYVGCTNQIELYPDSINSILLPNIDLELQDKIVEEIDKKIEKQNEFKSKINIQKEKIRMILNSIIM